MKHMIIKAAALLLAAAVLAGICACAGGYRVLREREIERNTANNEYASEEQRTVAEAALSLVGRVHYFWGGKSWLEGEDPAWGQPREVTGEGHGTTGKTLPFGLDCSGFVGWCFMQTGRGREWVLENVGEGTWHQWQNSFAVEKDELRIGDIVFSNEYPGAKSNHVGIVVGFLGNGSGEPLIAHCTPSADTVVVSTMGDTFNYYRRFAFLNGGEADAGAER
ncbi:MAG: C40 family peptidase [Clostridia bacterium]|nr:C40 family peptidase [Clostridia bacterium]